MKPLRSILSMLLIAALLASVLPISVFAGKDVSGTPVDGTVTFPYVLTYEDGEPYSDGDMKEDFLFRDRWFLDSSYTYNHALATASLASTMGAVTLMTPGQGISRKGEFYIRAFMNLIGCDPETVQIHNFQICNCYDDECAFAFGLKRIEGTDQYLLAALIRSSGYGGEWVSNFRLFDGEIPQYASGFRRSAEYAAAYLRTYLDGLSEYGIPRSDVKLWITGFSRGGAIANNLGQIMDEESGIEPENIFVYTFATPGVVYEKAAGSYQNIYNICAELDPIPRFPLSEWGLTRFGTTLYLPCGSRPDYSALLAGMQTEFDAIMHRAGIDYVKNEPFEGQERAIDLLFRCLADTIANPKEYYEDGWQDVMTEIIRNVKGYDQEEELVTVLLRAFLPEAEQIPELTDFFAQASSRNAAQNLSAAVKILEKLDLRKDQATAKRDMAICELLYCLISDFCDTLSSESPRGCVSQSTRDYITLFRMLAGVVEDAVPSTLMKQHWPETYLAWMRSGTEETLFSEQPHPSAAPAQEPVRGDVNGDGTVTYADAFLLRAYLLFPNLIAIRVRAADVDGNGRIDLLDAPRLTVLAAKTQLQEIFTRVRSFLPSCGGRDRAPDGI